MEKGKRIIYKFQIHNKLIELSKEKYDRAIVELPDLLNVKDRQFKNYRYAKLESTANIPIDKMVVLAAYFKCSVEDLITDIAFMREQVEGLKTSKDEFDYLS